MINRKRDFHFLQTNINYLLRYRHEVLSATSLAQIKTELGYQYLVTIKDYRDWLPKVEQEIMDDILKEVNDAFPDSKVASLKARNPFEKEILAESLESDMHQQLADSLDKLRNAMECSPMYRGDVYNLPRPPSEPCHQLFYLYRKPKAYDINKVLKHAKVLKFDR